MWRPHQGHLAGGEPADFAVVDIAGYETARDIEGFLAANQASSLAYAIDTDGRLVSGYQVSQLTTVLILTPMVGSPTAPSNPPPTRSATG